MVVQVWLAVAGVPRPARAEGAACAQARKIVQEVEQLYRSGAPDHTLLLQKLSTARNLCSSLGVAWKYSYCSALALGEQRNARIYRDRAVFNGISDLSCPAGGSAPSVAPVRPLPGYVRAKYALIVGISEFEDPQIPSLRYAAKDARDLAAVLTDPRYGHFDPRNVRLLTDAKATRANILNALQELFLEAREADLVFLYVSSHGSPRRDASGLGGVGYIVTYDTSVASIWVDALDYEGFSRKVSLIKARRKAVFLDTCYSGQALPGGKSLLLEGAGIDPETARRFLSGEGTYVVTSSRAEERSFESESIHNSYFTHFLMQALRRRGGAATLREIFDQLSEEVPAAVARDFHQPQHPQLVPADGPGDLRIGVVPRGAGASGEGPS